MTVTSLLILLIVGGIAGLAASWLVRGTGLGLVWDIVIGVVGAFLGSWLLGLIGGPTFTGLNIGSFIAAFVGALIILFVVSGLRGRWWWSSDGRGPYRTPPPAL